MFFQFSPLTLLKFLFPRINTTIRKMKTKWLQKPKDHHYSTVWLQACASLDHGLIYIMTITWRTSENDNDLSWFWRKFAKHWIMILLSRALEYIFNTQQIGRVCGGERKMLHKLTKFIKLLWINWCNDCNLKLEPIE